MKPGIDLQAGIDLSVTVERGRTAEMTARAAVGGERPEVEGQVAGEKGE